MAFTAKDGKPFGNRQKMKAYDERTTAEPKVAPVETEEPIEPDEDNVTPDNVVEVVKSLIARVDALDGGGHEEPDEDNMAGEPSSGGETIPGY